MNALDQARGAAASRKLTRLISSYDLKSRDAAQMVSNYLQGEGVEYIDDLPSWQKRELLGMLQDHAIKGCPKVEPEAPPSYDDEGRRL